MQFCLCLFTFSTSQRTKLHNFFLCFCNYSSCFGYLCHNSICMPWRSFTELNLTLFAIQTKNAKQDEKEKFALMMNLHENVDGFEPGIWRMIKEIKDLNLVKCNFIFLEILSKKYLQIGYFQERSQVWVLNPILKRNSNVFRAQSFNFIATLNLSPLIALYNKSLWTLSHSTH